MPMLLDRLTRHLILNYHFAPNAGLLNGKIGGVVFFGRYAEHTGKAYFREYAEELLDEVFDMVHENIPINFVDGLCGIGWGVEYLIQNSLMEGDSDDVLEDIDKKVIERDFTVYKTIGYSENTMFYFGDSENPRYEITLEGVTPEGVVYQYQQKIQ